MKNNKESSRSRRSNAKE